MTSKDQERKALEEIKKIVDRIGGDDSYIGMAFKGCFDIAENNIDCDFADSWMDRWSCEVNHHNETRHQFEATQSELASVKEDLTVTAESREHWKEKAEAYREESTQKAEALNEARRKAAENEKQIAELTETITHLKAKLYDLITA